MNDMNEKAGKELYRVEDLKVYYPLAQSFADMIRGRERRYVRAVDGVSFDIGRAEIVSLVGESGSGKSTIGKTILRLTDDAKISGKVSFDGQDLFAMSRGALREFRKKAQMIFQDPYQSINPKKTIGYTVSEPLLVNKVCGGEEIHGRVVEALDHAGLRPPEDYLTRYPHELSGGQRQRTAIAGAMVLKPEFLVADEPVSMLDVSIRADILKLIVRLRDEEGVSCLFITHDLSLAWLISNRIIIMYLGSVMEKGNVEEIVRHPCNPYTKALLDVMPVPEPRHGKTRCILRGEIPDPSNLPKGCRFHPRCPMATDQCRAEEPALREVSPGHFAACHYAEKV